MSMEIGDYAYDLFFTETPTQLYWETTDTRSNTKSCHATTENLTRDLTRLPPRDSTLDGGWTRKPFGLSRVQPIYLSIPRPS